MPRKPKVETKVSGDAKFVVARYKAQIEERDKKINFLENRYIMLDRCARRVWLALEEACGMADRYHQFIQDALDSEQKKVVRTAEMARYSKLFKEAKGDFERLRE